jgi:RNA polymerase sigma factor (sigma-70 family)
MRPPVPAELPPALLAHRREFKAFLAARLGNDADAEDVLQNGLVKALQHAGALKQGERAVPWFYQLLRNAVIDHARSRNAANCREQAWATQTATLRDDAEVHRQICGCFEKFLPALKPLQAELVRRVELQEQPVATAARELGLTPNQASVTLHRARAGLRQRLIEFCGDCRCLDQCDCGEAPTSP